ncbi:MAG: hypothetical protein H6728_06455 [Myxococcales bacterium]|nr:hypothetical protein [Myxococcales bacterium]
MPNETCSEANCGDGGTQSSMPPRIEPPAEFPKLGDVCSKDTDCGTGLICVLESEGNGHCFQDCSPAPLDCQKNTDGRTVCLRNEKEQRYCFQPKAKDGQRCGAGMQNDCDKNTEVPLYCNTKTWTCEKVAQSEKEGDACDLAEGKGCLAGLTCAPKDKSGRGVCYRVCDGDNGELDCKAAGYEGCARDISSPTLTLFCYRDNVVEGGACGVFSPFPCNSALSLYCDKTTKTCKKAPQTGKLGDSCFPDDRARPSGCEAGLLCLEGKCVKSCKDDPAVCAVGERCEKDTNEAWRCLPAKKGEPCEPGKTRCDFGLACDTDTKRCELRKASEPPALGKPCGSGRVQGGFVCGGVFDSFNGSVKDPVWLQDCEDDPAICSKNTDGRTACLPISDTRGGSLLRYYACFRPNAKEGEACGNVAQALCEEDDTSRHPKLLCHKDVCTRPTIQKNEGDPCDGPFLDIQEFLKNESIPRLCDRDAAVPLVCEPKSHTCVKAGLVGEGLPCLAGTRNLCEKGLLCSQGPFSLVEAEGVCRAACNLRSPQCPQGTSCKRLGLLPPKIQISLCTKD